MKIMETQHFCVRKVYRLITLISSIMQLLLAQVLSSIVSIQFHILTLNIRDTIIYVALWWKKHLSKQSLI